MVLLLFNAGRAHEARLDSGTVSSQWVAAISTEANKGNKEEASVFSVSSCEESGLFLFDENHSTETYDLTSKGIPRFVKYDYIEPAKVERISRFRSGVGHDYSDDFESRRSMKHYFQPSNSVNWASVQIRSPVEGTVSRLDREGLADSGTQIRIKSREFPAFYFILFHVRTHRRVTVGDTVSAGEVLGTHIGKQTVSDIAVGVNTPAGWKLVSYFEVMTDALFRQYQARGLNSRDDVIISKPARDAQPLTCVGDRFQGPGPLPNWVILR